MAGITLAVVVRPSGVEPLLPQRDSGRGRPPVVPRRTRRRHTIRVKTLAQQLPASAFQTISGREGSNQPLSGRFAAVRGRHAGGRAGRAGLRSEEWLLNKWPATAAAPLKTFRRTYPLTRRSTT